MYSSVASLHIALDSRIQQQNSNRKQAIQPEQYDIVLNDAISTVLKSRLSSKLNAKREAYEDSVTAYDSLKSLKRTCRPRCYFNDISNKWEFELPSNYYMFDTLQADIHFDRRSNLHNVKDDYKYISIIKFNNIGANTYIFNKDIIQYIIKDIIQYIIDDVSILTDDIHIVGTSNKASFYYFNLIKEWFKINKDIDCYFENYDGKYYPNSLIFVSDIINTVPTTVEVKDSTDTNIIDTTNSIITTVSTKTIKIADDDKNTTVLMGSKKIDLISSLNDTNETTDFYLHYNKHLNPKCIMQDAKVILTTDTTFNYSNLRLDYIKIPRIIDSRINQMTDMEITDDILDVATQLLMRTLNIRDPYAEQEAAQQRQQKQ